MNTRSIVRLGLFSLLIILLGFLTSCKAKENQNKQSGSSITNRGNDTYEKEWQVADSLISKGLPKSALQIVNSIYSKAKKNNNPSQIIKASRR